MNEIRPNLVENRCPVVVVVIAAESVGESEETAGVDDASTQHVTTDKPSCDE